MPFMFLNVWRRQAVRIESSASPDDCLHLIRSGLRKAESARFVDEHGVRIKGQADSRERIEIYGRERRYASSLTRFFRGEIRQTIHGCTLVGSFQVRGRVKLTTSLWVSGPPAMLAMLIGARMNGADVLPLGFVAPIVFLGGGLAFLEADARRLSRSEDLVLRWLRETLPS
jgi:hypothetical protein